MSSSSESEILAARVARMKAMIAELEIACANNRDHHDKFVKLKAELDAARAAVKTLQTHDPSASESR